MAENRKDQRAKVPGMIVRFKSATVDEFIEQPAQNVGRGGMFVTSPSPFTAGTLLKFELRAEGEPTVMAGVARVVWKRDAADGNTERPAGMGVKFIKIDDKSKGILGGLIDKNASGDAPPADAPKEEEKVAVVPKRAATMLGLGSIGTSKKDEAKTDAPKGDGGFFPATNPEAEMPPPEERTVMKQAAELLQQALAEAGGSIEGLEAPKPKAAEAPPPKAEEPAATPPVAEEKAPAADDESSAAAGIAAAIAETVAAKGADAETSAPQPEATEKVAEAKKPAPAEKKDDAPKAAEKKAEDAPKKAAVKPAAKESDKPTPAKAAPALSAAAEPEEGGGSGRMLMLLLAAAAIGGGLYMFISGSDDKPTTPTKPVSTQMASSKPVAVEPPKTAAPAPTPTPTESAAAAPTASASAAAAPSAAPAAKTAEPAPAPTPKPAATPKPASTPAAAAPPKPKPPKPKKPEDDVY